MNKITQVINGITGADEALMQKAQQRLDSLTKPQGSLGRLEELARRVVGITRNMSPVFKRKVIFTFAGDHGVTEEGISPFPQAVTAQMVYNFLNNGAGINVLANHAGAQVIVADLGVAADLKPHPDLLVKKVNYGTKNMLKGPAMTRSEAVRSIEAGIEIFEEELKKGVDIAGIGEMGIGNTTSSSAITAAFTKKPAEMITDRGTGIDDKGLKNKIAVIQKALEIHKPDPADAMDVLAKVGGFEIGGLTGVILAAASKKIPVVIDGFISGAAALIAFELAPKVKDFMISSHSSLEKGHRVILDHIGLKPLFDLDLRLGEGTGAALGLTLVEAAVKILTQMATFEEASVSNRA